jgi:hypothetical protein
MDVHYYDLGRPAPAVIVRQVRFFDLWAALAAELGDYYGEDPESFKLVEASWDNDDEYAELVTLNGRILGALHRPLTQENVAAIWGVKKVEKRGFINRIRSLSNIDSDQLPELTREQQSQFLVDPIAYLLKADDAQSDAIMREVESRQEERAAPKRKKRAKPRVREQGEFLLPIPGKKPAVHAVSAPSRAPSRRKAG